MTIRLGAIARQLAIISSGILLGGGPLNAQVLETFESWSGPQVSIAGVIDSHGIVTIADENARWLLSTTNHTCAGTAAGGPNPCYASGEGSLPFHGQHYAKVGDGTLLASRRQFSPTISGGMIVETRFRTACTNPDSRHLCFANVGIYENERNYRSIGFKSAAAGGAYFNIWGPTAEANYNGVARQAISLRPGQDYTFKMKYGYYFDAQKKIGVWRWDYFLNSVWIAGHECGQELGSGCFSAEHQPRIQISYGSIELATADSPTAAEGAFGPISYTVW